MKNTPNMTKAPKGLKVAITNIVKSLDKYQKNREDWIQSLNPKSPKRKRNGIISSNFKRTGTKLISDSCAVGNKFGHIRVKVTNLPFTLKLEQVILNLNASITCVEDCGEYVKFFNNILKLSKF